MLADTNPSIFMLVMLITAALIGPFIYACLRIIVYFLCPTSPNELQTIELQPTTRVGHSDGFCYLELFRPLHRPSLRIQLGHYPTIMRLIAVSASYQRRIRGTVEIIGDHFTHVECNSQERYVWDILEEVMARFEFIGSGQLRIISSMPPLGYKYTELFHLERRNEVIQSLGAFPCLQAIVNVNPDYRMEFRGVLWPSETVKDQWCLEKRLSYNVWEMIVGLRFGAEAKID